MKRAAIDRGVRKAITSSISGCGKSRARLADEISIATGIRVTEQMLNGYTAESKEKHRFPAVLISALCNATGNWSLLQLLVSQTQGLRLIPAKDEAYVRVGKQYVRQCDAQLEVSRLVDELRDEPRDQRARSRA